MMLTWLDHLCRQSLKLPVPDQYKTDPRRAFAYSVAQIVQGASLGKSPVDSVLDEVFYSMLMPIVAPYLPQGASFTIDNQILERSIGIVLTRATASFLAQAAPKDIPDSYWREKLGVMRSIYIDIPHGALTFRTQGDAGETLELRSIMAAPYLPPGMPDHTLFLVQLTKLGTEQGAGRIAAALSPDGKIQMSGSGSGLSIDPELMAPLSHPLLGKAVAGRAGSFLRLVLVYYCFGPNEAREAIVETATARLRNGKPRNGESLFAMTRLHPSKAVGRSDAAMRPSWSLSERQEVMGHFKFQAAGADRSERRLIWVDAYERGPIDGPRRPSGTRL